jgi:hypothetical protein
MRNLTGLILLLWGAWLLWSGWTRREAALAARAEGRAAVGASLAGFAAAIRPVVYVALGYLALKASLAYAVLDAGRVLSPFDLAGFLFLLAAYGAWLHLRTSCWDPAESVVAETPPDRVTLHEPGLDRSRGTLHGARDRAGSGVLTASLPLVGAPRDRAA